MRVTTRKKNLFLLGSSLSGTVSSSFVDWGVSEGEREGCSKSFGRFHYVCRGVLVTLVVGATSVFYLFTRLSSGPLGGHPHAHLKASRPHEAPIPAPTTKTLVPTTVNWRSTRAETTRRAPTFKIMARRVDWVAQRQHREATSHPSSQVGAGTYHSCKSTQ